MNADREQDALLEAIFANPADDTPRLVYADWLDEHGEGEYAEFIRLQIEQTKHRDPAPRKPLEKREREVWKLLKRKWRDLFEPRGKSPSSGCSRATRLIALPRLR